MAHRITSRRRAKQLSRALFLLGLAVLAFTGAWWPGMMLVVGIPLALEQHLLGRLYDALTTLAVFVGVFVLVQFEIDWQLFLPAIFTVGAIYILIRELTGSDGESEEEKDEDVNHEIEEKK